MEEYRDIPSFPHYQVSNLGNVRSNHSGEWKILRPYITGTRRQYYCVKIIKKNLYVHKLVAVAFIPKIEGKKEVDHIDRNKLNNSVENLRWVTSSENGLNTSRSGLNNKLGEPHIDTNKALFRVRFQTNKNLIEKSFHTLDEAKAWRDEQLLLLL